MDGYWWLLYLIYNISPDHIFINTVFHVRKFFESQVHNIVKKVEWHLEH